MIERLVSSASNDADERMSICETMEVPMSKRQRTMATVSALPIPEGFRNLDGNTGLPLKTMDNARTALHLLGAECRYDVFHDKRIVGGQVLGSEVGQVTDDVCLALRTLCREQFKFDPGKDAMWDAMNLRCREHAPW
jgi:hypothetical protein